MTNVNADLIEGYTSKGLAELLKAYEGQMGMDTVFEKPEIIKLLAQMPLQYSPYIQNLVPPIHQDAIVYGGEPSLLLGSSGSSSGSLDLSSGSLDLLSGSSDSSLSLSSSSSDPGSQGQQVASNA